MRTILIRLAELLGLSVILSSATCALYYYNLIRNTDTAYFLLLIIALAIFITQNVIMLRRCFWEFPVLKVYYRMNFIAYALFIAISLGVYFVFGEVVYAWTFNTLKLLSFSILDLHSLAASAITHFAMLVIIGIIPRYIKIPKRK